MASVAMLMVALYSVEEQRQRIIYEEQEKTAHKILAAFEEGHRQVLLNAMMQSGKTGAFLWAAFELLMKLKVANIVVICGSNENELHTQLENDLEGYVATFADDFCDKTRGPYTKGAARLAANIRARTKIYKSSDLNKATIPNKSIVIWDESHFAQSKENCPYKFFERNGVKPTGTPFSDDLWAAKECFFLSVSATPFAQFSDLRNPEFPITAKVVQHIPGEAYIGVKQYIDADRIQESYSIEENPEKFETLLRNFAGERKYALVRSHKHHEAIKRCCERVGVSYLDYNSTDPKGIANLDALKLEPINFTVIALKGMCRMGKVVPKQRIAFVFEESQSSKSDTVLQSLLGRMCGYGPYELPLVYVSPAFLTVKSDTGLSEMDRYTGYVKDGALMPARASHLSRLPKVTGKFLLPYPRTLVFRDDDEEDHGEASRFRDATHDERVEMIRESAIAEFTSHPLEDAVQLVEIMGLLRERDATRNVSLHDINSETYGDIRRKLYDATERKGRYDDPSWDTHRFKAYFDARGADVIVRLVGFTLTALDSTKLASKAPIAPTTGREAFNPARDLAEPIEHAARVVDVAADMATIVRTPGIHTLWIKKTLSGAIAQANALRYNSRGKNMMGMTAQTKKQYQRIVILVEAERAAAGAGAAAGAVAAAGAGAVAVAAAGLTITVAVTVTIA